VEPGASPSQRAILRWHAGTAGLGDGRRWCVIARSTDLTNWTIERPYLPATGGNISIGDVAYGAAGELVALGSNDQIWQRDPSSGVWSEQVYPDSPVLRLANIDFAGGQFFIGSIGEAGRPTEVLRSADGVTWGRTMVSPDVGSLLSFASGNGLTLGVGSFQSHGTAISSDAGASWATTQQGGRGVVFSDGRFHVVSRGGPGGVSGSSADGVTWEHFVGVWGDDIAAGIADGGYPTLVAVAAGSVGQPGAVFASINGGEHWSMREFGGAEIVYGDGVFVMRKVVSGDIYASLDGVNWEAPPAGLLSNVRHHRIAAGPGSEIAIGCANGVVKRFEVSARPLAREDSDGVPDAIEDGAPNGGDGNNDGILDRRQVHVTSLLSGDGNGGYLTVVSPAGTSLANVRIVTNPSPSDAPAGATFPFGILAFTVTGVAPGASVTVDVLLPGAMPVTDYFKFGPLPGSPASVWYDFAWDGATGATFSPGMASLTFVDGGRGDDDLAADGRIIDDGGPAFIDPSPPAPWPGEPPVMALIPRAGGSVEMSFDFASEAGVHYWLQASDDLQSYQTLQRVIAVDAATRLVDTMSTGLAPRRFYRVLEVR